MLVTLKYSISKVLSFQFVKIKFQNVLYLARRNNHGTYESKSPKLDKSDFWENISKKLLINVKITNKKKNWLHLVSVGALISYICENYSSQL